jgi:hypothetical protein
MNSYSRIKLEPNALKNLKVFFDHPSTFLRWILFACLIAFIVFVRIRILTTPLERDEGEYAYMGQLTLQGVPPYLEAFNMKLPGTSFMYAFFMLLFGQTITAIHLGLLIVNVASLIMVFLLVKKLFDFSSALIAAASFGLLSLSPYMLGFAAHATHFVILFALGAILMLLHALESEKRKRSNVILAGILFGCAFLMKQPGIFFFVFGLSLLGIEGLKEQYSKKQIGMLVILLTSGFIVPLLMLLALVCFGGSFHNFWFWVIQYAFSYGSVVPLNKGMMNLAFMLSLFWDVLPFFCILIGIGGILVIAGKLLDSTKNTVLSFGLFSCLALIPSLYFRYHYFILVLPAVCVFLGGGFYVLQHYFSNRWLWIKYFLVLLFVLVIGENAYSNRAYYFLLSPADIVRVFYTDNYFAESIPISNFLVQCTTSDERIAVVGSEPQILFYTKRRSVSGHIYMYGMMEPQPYARRMQEEFIADVERAQPKHLVCFWMPCSWLPNEQSDHHILSWVQQYTAKYYHRIATVDFMSVANVRYIWGDSARTYKPASADFAFIFERNGTNSAEPKKN